MMDMNYCSC